MLVLASSFLQEIEDDMAYNSEVPAAVIFPHTATIFVKRHIRRPMQAVFNFPMAADRSGKELQISQRSNEITGSSCKTSPFQTLDLTALLAFSPAHFSFWYNQSISVSRRYSLVSIRPCPFFPVTVFALTVPVSKYSLTPSCKLL